MKKVRDHYFEKTRKIDWARKMNKHREMVLNRREQQYQQAEKNICIDVGETTEIFKELKQEFLNNPNFDLDPFLHTFRRLRAVVCKYADIDRIPIELFMQFKFHQLLINIINQTDLCSTNLEINKEITHILCQISACDFKYFKYFIENNIISFLRYQITDGTDECCSNALWTLSNISGTEENVTVEIVNSDLIQDIREVGDKRMSEEVDKMVIWFFSNCSSFINNFNSRTIKDNMITIIKACERSPHLVTSSGKINFDIVWSVEKYLGRLGDTDIESSDSCYYDFLDYKILQEAILENLNFKEIHRTRLFLRIYGTVSSQNNEIIDQLLLDGRIFAGIKESTLFDSDSIRGELFWLLSNLASGSSLSRKLVRNNIFWDVIVMNLKESSIRVKIEMMIFISNFVECSDINDLELMFTDYLMLFQSLFEYLDKDQAELSLVIMKTINHLYNLDRYYHDTQGYCRFSQRLGIEDDERKMEKIEMLQESKSGQLYDFVSDFIKEFMIQESEGDQMEDCDK